MNITIHKVESGYVYKRVLFSLNFEPYFIYVVHISNNRIEIAQVKELNWDNAVFKETTAEEVLDIIRQGDYNMWTWSKFIHIIEGFALGCQSFKNSVSFLPYSLDKVISEIKDNNTIEKLIRDLLTELRIRVSKLGG